jgi:hypothetical protein
MTAAACAELEHLADENERRNDGSCFVIQIRATRVIAERCGQERWKERREDAESECDARAERNEREHVEAAMDDRRPRSREEWSSAPNHDRRREHELDPWNTLLTERHVNRAPRDHFGHSHHEKNQARA